MFTILISTFSIVLSLCAFGFSLKAFSYNKKRSDVESAINIAKEYQQLLYSVKSIRYLINKNEEVRDLLDRAKRMKIKEFTIQEINIIYNPNEQQIIKDFFSGNTMDEDALQLRYQLDNRKEPFLNYPNNKNELIQIAKAYYSDSIMLSLLNRLEYIAMSFNHNVAHDDVVFQSLHQSFFRIVEELYYQIAKDNSTENEQDYYYINIINMYNRWQNKIEKEGFIPPKVNLIIERK